MLSTDALRAGMNAARFDAPMVFNLRDPNYGGEERADFEMFQKHPYAVRWEDYSGPAEGHAGEHTGYGVIWMQKVIQTIHL